MPVPSTLRHLAGLALLAVAAAAPAQSPAANDPVLIENATAQVRRSDYLRELERLPAELRAGFGNSERRVNDLLRKLLMERTLAAHARAEKLPEKPEYASRLQTEVDKLVAQFKIADVEAAAAADFDARRSSFEARARELYVVDRAQYVTPEQVSASHILFETKTRSSQEAEKLARDAQAKLAAGADFNKLAREISEDRSAKANNGQIGWFTRAEMDPAFATAAFALKQPGEVSAPVLSSFGWHLIRFEGRRPQVQKPYEEVREQILAALKGRFVDEQREAYVARLRSDPTTRAHPEAIEALVIRVDHEAVRRKVEELQPGAMGRPAK